MTKKKERLLTRAYFMKYNLYFEINTDYCKIKKIYLKGFIVFKR